ncbi:hypothetical protein [Qaidamihabitans albus]|uniref:hypothetical protein n=1 Tax=Qaidamihabitans albus TaxID=2795733 RepID=UPI0018F1B0E8|nr:hypothetical protein [Qaidamihabitans albus]
MRGIRARDGRRPLLRTGCGREVAVTRLRVAGGADTIDRITLSISCQDHDGDRMWTSMTPAEARRLAHRLLDEAGPPGPGG